MSNIAEIDLNEMMRRDDEELYKPVDEWEEANHEYLAAPKGSVERLVQIEALEGQIIRRRPKTFLGLVKVLQMAHMIMSARDANPDCYIVDGPATALIARAIDAVDRLDGLIGRTEE